MEASSRTKFRGMLGPDDKDLKELGRGHWVVAGFSADELNGLAPFHQARGPPPSAQASLR